MSSWFALVIRIFRLRKTSQQERRATALALLASKGPRTSLAPTTGAAGLGTADGTLS